MMWWGNGGWGWMMFGGLMMIAFWVVVIVLAFLAVRAFTSNRPPLEQGGPGPVGRPNALDILKERYARGEITRDEYEAMRRDLMD